MANPTKSLRSSRASALSFDQSNSLTIKVGTEPNVKSFTAHQSFLTTRSEYFRRAMNGNWTESETRTVELRLEEPDTFALYLTQVYTGQLPVVKFGEEEMDAMPEKDCGKLIEEEYDQLTNMYILAERLQDACARNAIVRAFVQALNDARKLPSARTITLLYKATPQGRPLRCLFVKVWSQISSFDLVNHKAWLPKEFFIEICQAIDKQRKFPRTWNLQSSDYIESEGEI